MNVVELLTLLVTTFFGGILVAVACVFGWKSYVRQDAVWLQGLFVGDSRSALESGRVAFWVATVPLLLIFLVFLSL